jgi:HEAT repeat protein
LQAHGQVVRAVEDLVGGQFMSQLAVHLNGLRDEEFEQVRGLCAAVGPMLVPKLAETLSADTRPRVRQRLTDLLMAFGKHGRHSVDQLRQSPNPGVRRTAVQLLRSFGGPEALSDLEQLVNDSESAVRRDAARALIGLGIDGSFDVLKRILVSDHHRGREVLLEELGSTHDQKATPLLCDLVRHAECRGQLRQIYLQSLGRLGVLGGPDAIDALSEVLRKGGWWTPVRTREIRTEAAAALAQIKLPAAQDALRDAAVNGSFGVRSIARKYVVRPWVVSHGDD